MTAQRRPCPRRVALVGFMGAGKSSTGATLARSLAWRFVDIDRVIEAESGRAIAEIFATDGEEAFREREATAIADVSSGHALVLALGGGAFERPAIRRLILDRCRVVHLSASEATLRERLSGEEAARPLLENTFPSELLASRSRSWALAHLTVDTDGRSVDDVAAVIVSWLREEAWR